MERAALSRVGLEAVSVKVDDCYYIQTSGSLSPQQREKLERLLGGSYEPGSFRERLGRSGSDLEVGPRLSFATPWGTTAAQICHRVGLGNVARLERSRVYSFEDELSDPLRQKAGEALHDRMTQMLYPEPLESFESGAKTEPVRRIRVLNGGMAALKQEAAEMGLAMDDADLAHCLHIFVDILKRDPTDVELFQIGQANSEHCRHHFFRARVMIDGAPQEQSLMELIMAPYKANPANSAIAFHDDSSAIEGARALVLTAEDPAAPSALRNVAWRVLYTMTAETHNFPTGVAPFPGAATGTGGRIRDNECVGRGGRTSASLVGYATGDWRLPGAELPWEGAGRALAPGVATPIEVILGAMRGAWGYGNCFGEPVIGGWLRTLDLVIDDVRYAYLRPILYSAGLGFMREEHAAKDAPAPGMLVVQIGGPAYPIGVGGGAASSREGSGETADLDFNAVQRGDPAMAETVGRVVDACIAMGQANPIRNAHDLGAGGDANAIPEIVDPAGARIELRAIPSGDSTLSVMVLWGNESQERIAVLVRPRDLAQVTRVCAREGAPMAVLGEVTGDGRLVLFDADDETTPVNLPLRDVLGELPRKTLELERRVIQHKALELPDNLSAMDALKRVLQLPSVASKWAMILGVDRCVTGLIAQQQCVGPDHVPVSDYSVVADGFNGYTGRAQAIGERPLIGLVSPAAQGRMSVGEAVTNLMGAAVESLPRVRASVNVMAAAKQPGEGAGMYEAYQALSEIMIQLGMAADGGKDSLSLAVATSAGVVRGPRQIVVAAYAAMPDVRLGVTPDLKRAGSELLVLDLAGGKQRLGGSALAQAYGQVGADCPDVEDAGLLARAFEAVQSLVKEGAVSALHDRSDGGLITTLAEMAFAGARGCTVKLESEDAIAALFNEELGVVLECADATRTAQVLTESGVPFLTLGQVGEQDGQLTVMVGERTVVRADMLALREVWESTGSALDAHQTVRALVQDERQARRRRRRHTWSLPYDPSPTAQSVMLSTTKPKVAVMREVGTNGDRELAATFEAAGFEPWDVMTSDLVAGRVTLDQFQGLAMAGGFSFGDVLGAGTGWAGEFLFNDELSKQLKDFCGRPDTFSFGVCNGAQLSTLMGLVGPDLAEGERIRLVTNESQRFECRFVHVGIGESPSIMLSGMAGAELGIWVAHGEGRLHTSSADVLEQIVDGRLAPIRYLDPDGHPTTAYPANPNGSPHGIAGLCSADGRHLAMMPHPERLALQPWQWPYLPEKLKHLEASPWLRMFQNAHAWCMSARANAARRG